MDKFDVPFAGYFRNKAHMRNAGTDFSVGKKDKVARPQFGFVNDTPQFTLLACCPWNRESRLFEREHNQGRTIDPQPGNTAITVGSTLV
jgi:hypothetical protein